MTASTSGSVAAEKLTQLPAVGGSAPGPVLACRLGLSADMTNADASEHPSPREQLLHRTLRFHFDWATVGPIWCTLAECTDRRLLLRIGPGHTRSASRDSRWALTLETGNLRRLRIFTERNF